MMLSSCPQAEQSSQLRRRQETAEARQKIAEVEFDAAEAKKKVLHNFKVAGVSAEIIMQATGLSRNEVDDV